MEVAYTRQFLKDIKAVKIPAILAKIERVISQVKQAKDFSEITHLEKLAGYKHYYRIKMPPYRFGLIIENNIVTFSRFGTRENFYSQFP